jgi:hypothetical protein
MSVDHQSFAVQRPLVYQGQVTRIGGDSCSVVDAANYFDLPPLLERYGVWAITQNGIHCLYTPYYIDKSRLGEDDWVEHVTEKIWVVASDFIAVFNRAKQIWPITPPGTSLTPLS